MSTNTVPPEKKRKHKNKEHSPSKKRKHAATTASDDVLLQMDIHSSPKQQSNNRIDKSHVVSITDAATPDAGSPFRLINATMYLPLSPISISSTHAAASLIAEHLAPLLLTYYPPFKGIVLAYSNGSISESPPAPSQVNSSHNSNSSHLNLDNPKPLTLALTANDPQKGQILEGWVNVQSEGFVGAIAYNLFSVGIERKRVPKTWKWIPPGADDEEEDPAVSDKKGGYVSATSGDEDGSRANNNNKVTFDAEKEHFTPLPKRVSRKPITLPDGDTNMLGEEFGEYDDDDDEDEDSNTTGYFQSVSGHRVRGTVRFRVRDVDVIPGADPDRGFLSIEGTMLSPEEEARLEEEERNGPLPAHRQRDPYAVTGGVSSVVVTSQTRTPQNDVTEIRLDTTTTTAKSGSTEDKKKEKKSKDKSKSKRKE
ncbi:RNA polymerase I subunit Rpa43, putative [Talaromyces stipitatus ATCC 10500]|uniref:DNA-directed RNA polymerase subunit n=1 Tax=Talaromyces stipitatus (strain ATCC 10500 / CBS 375.48 / QM 6759 / NRRL 1006) TaxID=441959 RepID=B8MU07_TALSN|nr:RNA polymerase I subunit Rpa43, putative [Talaromyces stipitatus ATCC 10500]EED12640.1 RNA polymerase I subunit Rpa43, putative [Talaromyces stipitatus ATCC 10500]